MILTDEEKKMIEEKRQQRENAEKAEKEKELNDFKLKIRELTQFYGERLKLFDALIQADKDNIIQYDEETFIHKHPVFGNTTFTFQVPYYKTGNDRYDIMIDEHITYNSYTTRNKGMKYCLRSSLTNWTLKWYKKPETALKHIRQHIDEYEAEVNAHIRQKERINLALDELSKRFPACEIAILPYHVPDEIQVSSGDRSIIYTFNVTKNENGDETIVYSIHSVIVRNIKEHQKLIFKMSDVFLKGDN